MSRRLDNNHPNAFRVVAEHEHNHPERPMTRTSFHGPYATKAVAKGRQTAIVNRFKGHEEGRVGAYKLNCWIERTTGTWEKVEA